MTFATETEKQATQRYVLVRLETSLSLADILEDEGSEVWGTTFVTRYLIDTVRRSSTLCTETTANPPTVTNTYYYDPETGVFKIKLGIEGTPIYVVLNHSLYLTSREGGVVTYQDPVAGTGALRSWEPRIGTDDEPTINESVQNIFAGVLSLDSTAIAIQNADRWFQPYLTPSASFRDKGVTVWLCLNDESNVRRVYSGRSRSVTSAGDKVSVEAYDSFSALSQSAFFGDTADEAIYLRNGSVFTQLDTRKHGRPCRLIVGSFSRYKLRPGQNPPFSLADGELGLDPEFMEEAVCTDYTSSITTNTNRTWGICRTLDGLRNIVVGARNSVTNGGSYAIFTFTHGVWATMDLEVGDTVQIGSTYCRVRQIVSLVGWVEVYVRAYTTGATTFTTASTWTAHPAIELVIVDASGQPYYPSYGRDYTVTTTTTTGGNSYHEIEFDSSFETTTFGASNFFGDDISDGLDPGKHTVYFRVRPATTNLSHGNFMKALCEAAGLATDAASFTAADAAFSANVLMSIPWFDQDEYGTYRDYAEAVLEGTLGYLTVNTDGEAVYDLVGATAPAAAKTSDTIRRDSVTVKVDFNDVVSQVVAYNSHDYSDENTEGDSSATGDSVLAEFLHGIYRTTQLRHYLDTLEDRIDALVAVRSRPLVTCTWTTETEDLETVVGDDFTLETDQVDGGEISVKVIGIERSTRGVTVTAAQLEVA